jgi:hypothetical protein
MLANFLVTTAASSSDRSKCMTGDMGSPSTGENWLGELVQGAGKVGCPHFGERQPVGNDKHLALLRQGTAVWNEWRDRNPDMTLIALVRARGKFVWCQGSLSMAGSAAPRRDAMLPSR